MTTRDEIIKAIKTPNYDFLKTDEHLGKNVILLGLGGSRSYGVEKEDGTSDFDVRGVALNSKSEILLGRDFEQVVETNTDTTIYSFNKIIKLLSESNPNVIEMLGLKDEHYFYLHPLGKELLENKKMFLSQQCIPKFVAYANSQLRRMESKAASVAGQKQREEHILKSIQCAEYVFKDKYFPYNDGSIRLYTDVSHQEDYESEVFMDLNLSHYPLRDWTSMWNEMKAIVSGYSKMGKRNEKAIAHDKLGKHISCLMMLYEKAIDLLEKGEIITYREAEHDLHMRLRAADPEFLDNNRQPTSAFYDLLNEYEKRFEYASKHTSLPLTPDYKRIDEFKAYVNEKVVFEDF